MPKRLTQDVSVAAAIFLFAMVATAIVLIATPARAALSGGAGFDYQAGPEAQSCRGALLFASADFTPGDLTLAAIRYEDSRLGPGIGGFANAGVRVASALRLRAIGLRTVGDRGLDAWRLRAGPELALTPDVTLGAYYLRLHDGSPERFAAAGVELSLPVCPALSGQVGSSYGRWSGGTTSAQGTVAAMWRAAAPLQLLCEIDVGRNVMTTTSTSAPSGGGIWSGLPLTNRLGNGSSSEARTENCITSAAQFGIRYLFP